MSAGQLKITTQSLSVARLSAHKITAYNVREPYSDMSRRFNFKPQFLISLKSFTVTEVNKIFLD
jgi:hypothetical protein